MLFCGTIAIRKHFFFQLLVRFHTLHIFPFEKYFTKISILNIFMFFFSRSNKWITFFRKELLNMKAQGFFSFSLYIISGFGSYAQNTVCLCICVSMVFALVNICNVISLTISSRKKERNLISMNRKFQYNSRKKYNCKQIQ